MGLLENKAYSRPKVHKVLCYVGYTSKSYNLAMFSEYRYKNQMVDKNVLIDNRYWVHWQLTPDKWNTFARVRIEQEKETMISYFFLCIYSVVFICSKIRIHIINFFIFRHITDYLVQKLQCDILLIL